MGGKLLAERTEGEDRACIHVEEDDPGESDGEAPRIGLDVGLDVVRGSVVVHVHVDLGVLEVRWVVEHVENEAVMAMKPSSETL